MTHYWIGIASKKHVQLGVKGGFCQLNHGKKAPLQRMKSGDWLIYYSPKLSLEGSEPYQHFTAIGQIQSEEAYQVEMSPGFMPFRKDVNYYQIEQDLPLKALAGHPEWQAKRSQLRFGHFAISEELFDMLVLSMGRKEGLVEDNAGV
ncbi:EVE domain-containing protein [Vagococcus sp. BWB3-3]|uniref:UPF0310 protein I6N95_23945 n=1 Tax=Vagococcus allomyrinae TaxID=2794353 RepID=A0A940SU98_9ENTE|nr:EVE domain-containing protein [Vagococcus allomyrinae]MBP1044067.1 EVE domain-containing protein [Vagococcus allomyrinae]